MTASARPSGPRGRTCDDDPVLDLDLDLDEDEALDEAFEQENALQALLRDRRRLLSGRCCWH